MGNEASVAADGALRAVQERFEEKVAKLHNAMAPPNCRTNFNEEVNGTNGQQQAAPEMTQEQREGEIFFLFFLLEFQEYAKWVLWPISCLARSFSGLQTTVYFDVLGSCAFVVDGFENRTRTQLNKREREREKR